MHWWFGWVRRGELGRRYVGANRSAGLAKRSLKPMQEPDERAGWSGQRSCFGRTRWIAA